MSHNLKRRLKSQYKYLRKSQKYHLNYHRRRRRNSNRILLTSLKMLLWQPNSKQSLMQNQTQIAQMKMMTMVFNSNNSKV